MGERREGTVFIAEDVAPDKPHWYPGTFSAHWQGPRDAGFREGPRGVSVDEAIAWGREQADRVLIRLADSDYYSAGASPARDREPWPEGRVVEARREPGKEHLDLVTEKPIPWEVRLPRWISRERTETDVARLRAELEADPAVADVRLEIERGERVDAIMRFVVQARDHAEALQAVLEIEKRSIEPVPFPADELPDWGEGPFGFVIAMDWDPYSDIRPADHR